MWCPSCKADVAAEVAADNRRVRCATCGGEISAQAGFAGLGKTREARDLLERWASERQTEPTRPQRAAGGRGLPAGTAIGGITLEEEATSARGEARPAARIYRTDPAQSVSAPAGLETAHRGAGHAAAGSSYRGGAPQQDSMRVHPQESVRVHRQHDFASSPHFDVQNNLIVNERRRTNWTAIVGQLVAYAGVALLTVGTTLIVWSYFGGPANYAPTGWLTTTAGQMLLFLGVVTLVSGGMEQTNEDVRTRIERLGERIVRIEQIARDQALRGPYIPAEYYAAAGSHSGMDAVRPMADSRG